MGLLAPPDTSARANWRYARHLGRAAAGGVIFSIPILMTMEMWWLGSSLERTQLLQFAAVNFLLLIGLSRLSGFEETQSLGDDMLDAFAAYGVAAIASLALLAVFGIVTADMRVDEIVGKVAIQAVPASFGAMLAGKQLGNGDEEVGNPRERASYAGQLFLMAAGALFLGFSVAPTEEVMLISFRMSPWHSIALIALSILLLHVLVYSVGFKGQEKPQGANGATSIFLRFTLVGYALAVLVSLYLLWTFGRVEDANPAQIASMVAVLAFPGALGAAIARLVI